MQTFFLQDLYAKHLSTINNIHFTAREIDLVACLLSARRTSKIAFLLSIDPRTVETHIRNIMSKLGCHTREGIIDFIEASDKLLVLRKYYSLLRINVLFEKSLQDISNLNQRRDLYCFLISGKDKVPLIPHLKSHLKLAGITVSNAARKKDRDYVIFVLPKTPTDEDASLLQKIIQSSNKILFVLQERRNYKECPKETMNFAVIDLAKYENYYFSFFVILKKILPDHHLEKIISEFKDKYKQIDIEPKQIGASSNEEVHKNQFFKRIRHNYFLIVLIFIGLFGSGLFLFQWSQANKNHSFRSNLVVPVESVLLNRPELITQIDEKLKKRDGIQTVALTGPGGSGKTTLARQYGHLQKTNPIWEINAETRESLNASFEKLAQVLASTEIDQRILRGFQEIKDPTEKEDRIIQFVKERLKLIENWVLIYDNLETFADIQKHFPHDSDTWGQGKIILTTRDANIENNKEVTHTIPIGELSPTQKLNLFKKVMEKGNARLLTVSQTEKAKQFLEKIPPFPLDVSIAAYYLKATSVPYVTYLENLSQFNKDFANVQKNLLKEIGDYTNTRYHLITSSLQSLINTHKDFGDLLLLMCLIDSQNIPRNLLNNFKGDVVVDNFILNLKKYSLITHDFSTPSSPNPFFSIHRSTQAIALSYFTETLGLERNKKLIEAISENLEDYVNEIINKDDLVEMKSYVSHCVTFLKHKYLLTPSIEGTRKGELGIIYYFFGDNIKARMLFEESLLKLDQFASENPTRIALSLGFLGNVFRDLGDYGKGKMFLEKSLSIYEQYYPREALRYGYFVTYLGIIERILGKYEVAKNLFEKGLMIHKKHFAENENYMAWVSGQLGIIDREQGNHEKAKNTLERSLIIYKKIRSSNHFDVAWALEHLGVVYTKLGDYEKAKETLEECLKIYAYYFPDQIGPSWILAYFEPLSVSGNHTNIKNLFNQVLETYRIHFHESYIYAAYPMRQLGILHIKLGNYEKAKIILEQSLAIYQKNYGKDHLTVAQILDDLGQVCLLEGHIEKAENFFRKAMKIFQQSKHPESYSCLENLAAVFIKKSMLAKNEGDSERSQSFKALAISYLDQALKVVKTRFPENSLHTKRIQETLKKL
ncbi:MAG: hypothetical protein BGO67_03170 [Alphaproteobacteria bacterium 41-28]|nr:MAG: hypothetical protein BGO67_03170 [Alphaproteobacteria bacterium 41-28]